MNSDFTPSSFSSASPPLLMTTNNKDESTIALNDVVAVSNGEDGYSLGKVVELRDDSFLLTLYNFKLHTRTNLFKKIDLIMNFGSAGGKQIFEMTNDQQKVLLERIRSFNQDSLSLSSLVVDVRKKEEDRVKLVYLLTDLFGQTTINDNGKQLLLDALQKTVLDCNEFMEIVCVMALKQDDETIINRLADDLAEVSYEKKSLSFIESKLVNDQSLTHFLKKCLWNIGQLIGTTDGNNFDESLMIFSVNYIRLSGLYWKP